jgi:hypothetical protein
MNVWLRAIAISLLVHATIRAESPSDVGFSTPSQFSAESHGDEEGHDGPLVGQLGDPASIRFVGLEQLTAKQLRNDLSTDLDYQAAARPSSPLPNLLSVLETRLLAGLRHSGFMDATVATTYNAEKNAITVTVSEGALFKNGSIRIEGTEKIDGSSIVQQLARPGKAQPWTYFFGENKAGNYANDRVGEATWKKREVTDSYESTIERLTMRIRQLMIEQGYPFAVFTVGIEPETADTAALVVRITSEGSPGVVANFKLTGLTRHSEEQLLNYLGLKQGSSVNAQVLKDVHAKLRDSCRFWGHRLWLRVPDVSSNRYSESPQGLEIAITLTEYEHVPLLDSPLSVEEESMIRFAHWLQNHGVERFSESGDLVIQSSSPSAEWGMNFRCVISPRQGILLDVDGEIDDLYVLHHAAIITRGQAELVNWSSKSKLTMDASSINSAIKVQWTSGNVENGEYRSRLVLAPGIFSQEHNSAQSASWSITCDPVAAVHLLHRQDATYERVDGELRVRSADTELCIEEATGRLKQMSLKKFDEQNQSVNIHFEPGAFEQAVQDIHSRSQAYTEGYDTDEPVLSVTKFAIDELLEQPFIRQSQLRQMALSWAGRGLDRIWLEKLATTVPVGKKDKPSTKFDIPSVEMDSGDGDWNEGVAPLIMRGLIAAADELFPRGSWPWTYTREAVFGYASTKSHSFFERNAEGLKPEIRRVIETTELGPLASLVPLLLFREYLPGEAIVMLVQRGRQELNVEPFTNDIRLLSYNEALSDHLLTQLTLEADQLNAEQRDALRSELPPPLASLLDRFVERRKIQPTESATKALEAVIQETWSAGLSDSLADFLGQFGQ